MIEDSDSVDQQSYKRKEAREQKSAKHELFDPVLAINTGIHGAAKEAVYWSANGIYKDCGRQK